MAVHNTHNLRQRLQEHYPPPEWAMAFEVQCDTPDGLRFADAVAINTRKSSSMPVLGFELKVSRADLLHELKQPGKSQPASSVCDYWYLVVGHERIVKDLPIPPAWGILVADDDGIRTLQPASRNPRHDVDRSLVASVMRRLLNQDATPKSFWEQKIRMARQAGFNEGRNYGLRTAGKISRERVKVRELDLPLNLP